jgi:GT2 family glycosyltransferase
VDDKSTSDLTLSFLKAFLPQRPQFSYVRNKDNVGCGESRNIGLAHATEKDDLI